MHLVYIADTQQVFLRCEQSFERFSDRCARAVTQELEVKAPDLPSKSQARSPKCNWLKLQNCRKNRSWQEKAHSPRGE